MSHAVVTLTQSPNKPVTVQSVGLTWPQGRHWRVTLMAGDDDVTIIMLKGRGGVVTTYFPARRECLRWADDNDVAVEVTCTVVIAQFPAT